MDENTIIEEFAAELLRKIYSDTVFETRLYELFCKKDELVHEYIKVGRKFWRYDDTLQVFRKLTVTYVRTGVVFYTFDDVPDKEESSYISSFNVLTWHAAEIHVYEISKLLSKYYETAEEFADICKTAKFDDCDGRITVDIIWD